MSRILCRFASSSVRLMANREEAEHRKRQTTAKRAARYRRRVTRGGRAACPTKPDLNRAFLHAVREVGSHRAARMCSNPEVYCLLQSPNALSFGNPAAAGRGRDPSPASLREQRRITSSQTRCRPSSEKVAPIVCDPEIARPSHLHLASSRPRKFHRANGVPR